MNDKTVGGVHWSFWVIGAVALIWNVMGGINFLAQMNADTVASMPESYRAVTEDRPAWATGAFAIAVFGGALGCLLLLLRKSAAVYLFIASLLGVIATMIHARGTASSTIDFSPVLIKKKRGLIFGPIRPENKCVPFFAFGCTAVSPSAILAARV